MKEPTQRPPSSLRLHFYKPMTELTAFIVNMRGTESHVEVTYGYASTAFTRMKGDENRLIEWGVDDEYITLRERIVLRDESDERLAKESIARMYTAYQDTEKGDLLLLAKEKKKAFLMQIHAKLKPLGFRKKASTWTHTLSDPFYLMFNAQLSAFSDEYYFNVYIGKNGTKDYGDCYYTRIAPDGISPLDWQTFGRDAFDAFLEATAVPKLMEILNTPLEALGVLPAYHEGCHCRRDKCKHCWMQKNLWEANG